MKKVRNLWILVMAFLIFVPLAANGQDIEVSKEKKKEYYSLDGWSPDLPNDDLVNLKEVLKDKEIIGVGEGTHGTKEFFEMRHRFFKFLVEELDFRAFGIENCIGPVIPINQYIQGEEVDENIEKLIDKLMKPWKTVELKNFIEWAREYNIGKKESERVRFYGFDMQEYNTSIDSVLKEYYVEKMDKHDDSVYKKYQRENGKFAEVYYDKELYQIIKDDLKINKKEYIEKTSNREYDMIVRLVRNKINWEANTEAYGADRDSRATENVVWLQGYEEKYYGNNKIMLWAHNAHIGASSSEWMGSFLKDVYGDKYYSIAQHFATGTFLAEFGNPQKYEFSKSAPDTMNDKLNKIFQGQKAVFMDIRDASADNKLFRDIFYNTLDMHEFSAASPYAYTDFITPVTLAKEYDAVIFIPETTATTLLRKNPKDVIKLKAKLNLWIIISGAIIGIVIIRKIIKYRKNRDYNGWEKELGVKK